MTNYTNNPYVCESKPGIKQWQALGGGHVPIQAQVPESELRPASICSDLSNYAKPICSYDRTMSFKKILYQLEYHLLSNIMSIIKDGDKDSHKIIIGAGVVCF